MPAITITDFNNAKTDVDHIADLANSQNLTAIDRLGTEKKTLAGILASIGYEAPIAYAGGIGFTTSDTTKTVEESGVVYAPFPSALPFTTSGTFVGDDDARFYPIQFSTSDTPQKVDDITGLLSEGTYNNEIRIPIGYHPSSDIGGGEFYWDSDLPRSNHNGGTIISPSSTWDGTKADLPDFIDGTNETSGGSNGCWVRIFEGGTFYPEWWGAVGDGTNYYEAIQAAADYVQSTFGGGELRFGVTGDSYNLGSNSLLIRANAFTLSGVNPRAHKITTSNQRVIANDGTTARFYIKVKDLYLSSTANSARVLDYTYFKNSYFENNIIEADGGSNPSLVYGEGTSGGASPYYNTFINNDLGFTGGASGSLIGYHCKAVDIGGGTIRGPNSNVIIGGRVAGALESMRVEAGNNNTFQGVASEAVLAGGYDITMGQSSGNVTGTATGGDINTLTDSGASFTSALTNGTIVITSGTGAGQTRKIDSVSSTDINTKTPFKTAPDGTSEYSLYYPACSGNTFINNRSEGSTSKAGIIRRRGGEYQNEVIGGHASSLGSGVLIDEDVYDPSNLTLFNGLKPPTPYYFYQDNVAASQTGVQINALSDGTTEYPMISDGEIIGISVRSNQARTAGTLTVKPTVNGVDQTLSATLNADRTQDNNQVGAYGDNDIGGRERRLGVEITTDGSWAPTTADVTVVVWVLHRN